MKVRFGSVVLDTASRQLTEAGAAKHLSPKAFDLLAMLVERRPAVVEKAAIRQRLWPDTHVVEASLTNLVAEVRGVLTDSSLLRTVHGVGYAFDGEAVEVEAGRASEAARPAATPFWIVWKDRPIVLAPGDNVIGRDAACAVWIDAGGVSRKHARIRVPADGNPAGALIDDLNSTNGTFIGRRRVTDGHPLENGDRIKLGDATLIFRALKDADAPTKRVKPPKGRSQA